MDFTAEELAEMQVDVAGREDSTGAKRRKRAMRVPADEVPRTVALNTEPELAAIPETSVRSDELVDHAFSNGGRAEADVLARTTFTKIDDEWSKAAADDDDLEPEM